MTSSVLLDPGRSEGLAATACPTWGVNRRLELPDNPHPTPVCSPALVCVLACFVYVCVVYASSFIANEPTFGKQDVNARFSSAPPHPNGQHRFAIEAVSDIARGEEVCVCYGRWYQRSYPSHWD